MPNSEKFSKGAPLRNYCLVWIIRFQVTIFDAAHVQTDQFFAWATGRDANDLVIQLQAQKDLIASGLPAGWTVEFDQQSDPQKAYVLLDKDSVFHFCSVFAGTLWNDLQVPSNVQVFRCQVEKTPRYTGWKDASGENHPAPPSDKPIVVGRQLGNIQFSSLTQEILTIWNLLYQKGIHYLDAQIQRLLTRIANKTVTQADIDAFFQAIDGLLG